jgi:hypothetical protein
VERAQLVGEQERRVLRPFAVPTHQLQRDSPYGQVGPQVDDGVVVLVPPGEVRCSAGTEPAGEHRAVAGTKLGGDGKAALAPDLFEVCDPVLDRRLGAVPEQVTHQPERGVGIVAPGGRLHVDDRGRALPVGREVVLDLGQPRVPSGIPDRLGQRLLAIQRADQTGGAGPPRELAQGGVGPPDRVVPAAEQVGRAGVVDAQAPTQGAEHVHDRE